MSRNRASRASALGTDEAEQVRGGPMFLRVRSLNRSTQYSGAHLCVTREVTVRTPRVCATVWVRCRHHQ
jgi:hypothetical protein